MKNYKRKKIIRIVYYFSDGTRTQRLYQQDQKFSEKPAVLLGSVIILGVLFGVLAVVKISDIVINLIM